MAPRGPATLRLRGRDHVICAEVTWPTDQPNAVLILFGDAHGALIARRLAHALPAVALTTAPHSLQDALELLAWSAEHATELDAPDAPLLVAGLHTGADLAARLAIHAGLQRWPPIATQILIHPWSPTAAPPLPQPGVAPAIISTDRGRAPAYAEVLRSVGVRALTIDHRDAFAAATPAPSAPSLLSELIAATKTELESACCDELSGARAGRALRTVR
jgi:hypothetical protein